MPIAVADHAGPLFRSMFPDNKIAQSYDCARTKATCIMNGALAVECADQVISKARSQLFTLCLDGSIDQESDKLIPITVRLFDHDKGMVVARFLDMCLSSSGTAAAYFEKLECVFSEKNIPSHNCVGFSVDSASVNIGKHNSIKTRIEGKYSPVYTLGCPCHFIHNAAHHATKSLEASCGFDVEGTVVDVFYYFDHSTKRKGELRDFATFCIVESRKILKHVSTRWLSLQASVLHILKQYRPLRSYFLSQDPDNCLNRLQKCFSNLMTEIYLCFSNLYCLFSPMLMDYSNEIVLAYIFFMMLYITF